MAVELVVPTVGESITEVQIGDWLVGEGQSANKEDALVVIETDKVTVELPAPIAGTVTRVLKKKGDKAAIGEVIGYIESGAPAAKAGAKTGGKPGAKSDAGTGVKGDASAGAKGDASTGAKSDAGAGAKGDAKSGAKGDARTDGASETRGDGAPSRAKEPAPASARSASAAKSGASAPTGGDASAGGPREMPAAARELAERGMSAGDVEATGPGGRVLKEDVVRAAEAPARTAPPSARAASPSTSARATPAGDREEEIVPMTPLRRRIAERLVEAQNTAALLTTFNEIDMSAAIALRNEHKDAFQKRHGVKLGFMSFFVKASIDALKLVPQINAEIRGDSIVYRNYYDVGVAVGGGKGLVVPILRNADRMSFAEVETAIAELASRAQANKLSLEELSGGTFTISNGGIYGSLLSTPIVNPPQSGILGLHAIQDRAVVRDGAVVVRPMMYVAVTYDHRLVDGREAVGFLKRIKECVEDPSRMLLEI